MWLLSLVVSHPRVTRATPADRTRVVETVVAAFDADPAFHFFFPDDASFRDQAATFTGQLFDERAALGAVWIVEGAASVAMWDPPSPADGGPRQAGPALELPADTLARLEAYDAAVYTALPTFPHWYLGIVATHPEHAGRGWGRTLIAAGLDRAAEDGLPAYLETTNPNNVELYRRAGWEVTESVVLESLTIWVMTHPPLSGRDHARSAVPAAADPPPS